MFFILRNNHKLKGNGFSPIPFLNENYANLFMKHYKLA